MNDASELQKLAVDLGSISRHASGRIQGAVSKAALNIKDDWNKNLSADAPGSLSGTGQSVSYDLNVHANNLGMALTTTAVSFEAEIGPEVGRKRTQGPMAGWFETGAVDGVPQTKPGDRAAKANEKNFYDYLETAAADAIRDAL